MRLGDNLVNALVLTAVLMFALLVYDYFVAMTGHTRPLSAAPEVECSSDYDCPTIYCIRAPCPRNVCSGGSCVAVTPPEEEAGSGSASVEMREKDGCKIGGCSGQICADASRGEMISTCEWKEAYGCYQRLGICERQPGGECGWTQTEELVSCIEGAS